MVPVHFCSGSYSGPHIHSIQGSTSEGAMHLKTREAKKADLQNQARYSFHFTMPIALSGLKNRASTNYFEVRMIGWVRTVCFSVFEIGLKISMDCSLGI